ncbi:carbohydrate ABC transporter permease [Metabacillus arenae]|uniref:Sugar ABC transporter permease n=1 Tax=Metabacillus arenae TaxID=2771434 RepID=A0A926NM47_9BACI|nr:sugar ABC transporter permease [Metabacillus arenae]MBD1382478.1 sugar ABC transporter permease [Metabacillus arenae]
MSLVRRETSVNAFLKVKEKKAMKRKYNYMGYVFILPWLIGLFLFELYPLIYSFYLSFTEYDVFNPPKFVGFENYIYMFTRDPEFYNSLKVTLIYVFIAVPLKVVFALIVALLLNLNLKGMSIYRTIFYLPSILGGSVAVAILWRFLFTENGLINGILSFLNLPTENWLGNPNFSLLTISLLTVWQFGSSMVLFLAGLKQVPKDLYEAARVDGASNLRVFFSVTLPILTPIVLFNLVMQTINAFQEFTAAFVITNGGPLKSTYLYGIMLYENAFSFLKMGYASALSWVLFIIILLFTSLLFLSSKHWIHYQDEE